MKSSRLVCVDDSIKFDQIVFVSEVYQQWVKKGEEYTVRQVLENDGIVTGVLLNEVVNEPIWQKLLGRYQEPAFRLNRFNIFAEVITNEKQKTMATKMRTGRMTVKTKKTNGDPPVIGSSKQTGAQNEASAQEVARRQMQYKLLREGWSPESLGMNRDSLIKTNPTKWADLAKPAASTKKPVAKPAPTKVVINKQTGKTKVTKR